MAPVNWASSSAGQASSAKVANRETFCITVSSLREDCRAGSAGRRASNLEENLPFVKPITHVPQACQDQNVLWNAAELSEDLEISRKIPQLAIQPAFNADLAKRIDEDRIHPQHDEG